jgi:predicted metal-dependent HD superfamily phosphohydrolase
MNESELRERFGSLWGRLGGRGDGARAFNRVLQGWQEPHRHYHGLDHLRDCLARLDEAPAAGGRDLAEMALWYHDVVYLPQAHDNEAQSADRAVSDLLEDGVPAERAREIGRLVRLTDHITPPEDPVGELVCDVDLSILGRPAEEYAEYERRIRAEYAHVPEPLYRAGRAAVLARLLARQPLYRSRYFRTRYEDTARRNLTHALAAIGRAPGGA